jgi:ribosome biogenesis GTPase / thiamine phosphate phosphatase
MGNDVLKEGRVIKSTGSRYTVMDANGDTLFCHIKGKFRIKGIKTTNPVAVGDHVTFSVPSGEGHPVITHIGPRKNYIIRRASNLSKLYHIIAANIDQALLTVTLQQPVTTTMFIDRFLITAEAYSIPAVLLFNKTDLYNKATQQQMNDLMVVYEKIGYPCIDISCQSGHHLDKVAALIKGKVSLISGNSGVGKSTLINKLDPALDLKTTEISAMHETGKHTTTFAEMHPLQMGGFIIDTPGIKSFGIIDFDTEEIYHYFPEIFQHSKNCRFHNCLHLNEPGCSVKEAVQEGQISVSRYQNYVGILVQKEEKYR